MTADELTERERQDLRLVAARARMDQGDVQPMRQVWRRYDGSIAEETLPWLAALNMEVGP